MAATKKENKDVEELEELEEEKEEENPPKKKAAATKKEDTPEWFQTLNSSIQELTNQLKPVKATKGTIEIPIPNKPKPQQQQEEENEEDQENNPPQQKKKQSFLEWLM